MGLTERYRELKNSVLRYRPNEDLGGTLPNLSGLLNIAAMRYMHTVHESGPLVGPDTLVRKFLPAEERRRIHDLDFIKLWALRRDPFYYYLLARTRHYDRLWLEALSGGCPRILNIGCGTDTRAYRFADALESRGVSVLEVDQPSAIQARKELVAGLGAFGHVRQLGFDLHDTNREPLRAWIAEAPAKPVFVVMEGLSPYIDHGTFTGFLGFLAACLPVGSTVAYDLKVEGAKDDMGREGRPIRPFRLLGNAAHVEAYHQNLGFRVIQSNSSQELVTSVLQDQNVPRFREDWVVHLGSK